jgi:O-antigen ligase
LFDNTWLSATTKIVNFFVFIELILHIYKKTVNKETFFYRAIINIVFFFCISCFISPLLGKLGYYTRVEEEGALQRFNGFIGNGDANTLALILVLSVGYILNKAIIYRLDMIKISMMLLSIITIGLTGSRSGLILLGFIFLSTPFFFKKIKIFSKYTLVMLVMIFFSTIFLSTNIERLNTVEEEQMTTTLGTGNRVGKWLFYINYFKENPYSLLRGASDVLEVGFDHSFIVAHNIYLQIIYNSGLLFLVALIYIIYKSFKINTHIHENILILLIPLVLGLFFISDYGAILFFVICLFGMTIKKQKSINIK